jgi:flagellar basal-body rod protein FlgC
MDIMNAMGISSLGMKAQGARIRVISQNVANADTTALQPNEDPYRRKVIMFRNEMNKEMGTDVVTVKKIEESKADFKLKFMPDHPAADENGYVKTPNVNSIIEMMDMREAQRSYEANLGMLEMARSMMSRTLDLLRG